MKLYALVVKKVYADGTNSWWCDSIYDSEEEAEACARTLHESGQIVDWKINLPKNKRSIPLKEPAPLKQHRLDLEEDIFVVITINKKEQYAQGLRLFRTIKDTEKYIKDYSKLPGTEQLEFSYNVVDFGDDS